MERPALGHVRDDEAAGDAAVAHEERPARKEEGMKRLVSDGSNSTSEYHSVTLNTFQGQSRASNIGNGREGQGERKVKYVLPTGYYDKME